MCLPVAGGGAILAGRLWNHPPCNGPTWIDRLYFWRDHAERDAARHEVLSLIRSHPVEGYGLYRLLRDAGLLTRAAERELAPLVARIEQRLTLPPEACRIGLWKDVTPRCWTCSSSCRYFEADYLQERALVEGEVLRVLSVWEGDVLLAERLWRTSRYSKPWWIRRARETMDAEPHLAVLHRKEVQLYRPHDRYTGAVARLVELYRRHAVDHSTDPTIYQPDAALMLPGDPPARGAGAG